MQFSFFVSHPMTQGRPLRICIGCIAGKRGRSEDKSCEEEKMPKKRMTLFKRGKNERSMPKELKFVDGVLISINKRG